MLKSLSCHAKESKFKNDPAATLVTGFESGARAPVPPPRFGANQLPTICIILLTIKQRNSGECNEMTSGEPRPREVTQ